MEVLYNINKPLRSEDIDVPLTNVRPVKKVALVIVAGDSWSLWRFGQYIPRSRPRTCSTAVYFGTCEFASLTTPLDVEKTRLMTQVHGGNKVAAVMYSGVNALLKLILKEEGWIGLTSRVVHSACFSALS
ncbi:hypothetical protein E1A91_D10G013900v1 [Gossypium mustelinum]|uniref:Uncharacterized protein n=3 Tax=Gossypium TaxID=3633 RepID=A0A5J5PP78_GOSBA|nr:hypothetical protein ES319_D10G013300v1 [Gossypium barbadense]TYG48431.1 hypothetical protein ES288_D10G013700v1 [Gossypium darwinii]TYI59141.1 hypothetical protein E1A91_D10G013900v1 [Gossypium mustelinum]